jgi:adenylate cyclase, class 2
MLEVEMKFPVADFASLERRLAALPAQETGSREDLDLYFNAPDRDFAKTDEAFRLRRFGAVNFLTYKGPKLDAQTKTRTEIEISLAEGDETAGDCTRLLTHLGYRPVGEVRKKRRRYHLKRAGFATEVTLDEVEGLGCYVELEIVAPEENLEPARQALLDLAATLGLTHSERRSYLELLLTRRGEAKS